MYAIVDLEFFKLSGNFGYSNGCLALSSHGTYFKLSMYVHHFVAYSFKFLIHFSFYISNIVYVCVLVEIEISCIAVVNGTLIG